ncbi:MAG: hypothetical protein M0Z52_07355 [Actinomycetota bacterium]|nr:hypothetical protein [Actinomycetota bacterium]
MTAKTAKAKKLLVEGLKAITAAKKVIHSALDDLAELDAMK